MSLSVMDSKVRVTILCCVSMTGEKLPILVFGSAKKAQCFKNNVETLERLDVKYTHSKKAWMTGNIFHTWLIEINGKMFRKTEKFYLP